MIEESRGFSKATHLIKELLRHNPSKKPSQTLPAKMIDLNKINRQVDQVFWLGHSASLIVLEGELILIDPMLGQYASPIPGIYQRFASESVIDLEPLDQLAAVVFSHNHYDHLDKQTVLRLASKTNQFIVPQGMSGNLTKWGIRADKIKEIKTFQEQRIGELTLTATPAKHYSGRGLTDKNKSECASWVIKTAKTAIFYSGDSAYDDHFTEIGKKYGPFDLVLMECGQYDSHWPDNHMFPEQSVQAVVNVGGNHFIPVHWAGFALGFHPWQEPVERARVAANDQPVNLLTPMMGEPVRIHQPQPTLEWWREVES